MKKFDTPTPVKARLIALGELIRAARRERGFTQAQLAERAGTSRPTINRIESGRSNAAWGTVMTLCWLLDIPSDPDSLTLEKQIRFTVVNATRQRVRTKKQLDDNF